jgi:DNA-directed RNA polymerase subunit RPC12/RpoP
MIKHCIDCGKLLNKWAKSKNIRCRSCASKFNYKNNSTMRENILKSLIGHKVTKATRKKMKNSWFKKGFIPWNKGRKGDKGYWTNKKMTDIIVKHHIDLNKKNNNRRNFLYLSASDHIRLHTKAYHYLVLLNIHKEYLKDFCKDNKAGSGNVKHHIDCNRQNNIESNYLYLPDRNTHMKLHRRAYEYLVRKNIVIDYINWLKSIGEISASRKPLKESV